MEKKNADQNSNKRGHQIVESLLAKPSKKPNFAAVMQPDILKRAQAFLPAFIQSTDKILSNPDLLRASQMDVKICRAEDEQQARDQAPEEKAGVKVVNMVSNCQRSHCHDQLLVKLWESNHRLI